MYDLSNADRKSVRKPQICTNTWEDWEIHLEQEKEKEKGGIYMRECSDVLQ